MTSSFRPILGLLLGLGSLALAGQAEGGTIQVPAQYPTIQRAIDAAVDGDVVRVKAGIYQPAATLDTLGKAITIEGEVAVDGTPLTIIDGRDAITVLQCTSGENSNTIFENLIIRNGRAAQAGGGMLILNASSPSLVNCSFIDNESACYGGAVASISQGFPCNPSFVSCTFERNEAGCDGGAYFADSGTSVFVFCEFRRNRGQSGGGLANLAGFTSVVYCEFTCNEAEVDGGGLHFGPLATANIDDSKVQRNSALGVGGGIRFNSNAQSLANSVLCDNLSDQVSGPYANGGGNSVTTTCGGVCVGDVNGDGRVNGADLALVIASWGICPAPCPTDLNGDGIVNGTDLAMILGAWGPCSGGCP